MKFNTHARTHARMLVEVTIHYHTDYHICEIISINISLLKHIITFLCRVICLVVGHILIVGANPPRVHLNYYFDNVPVPIKESVNSLLVVCFPFFRC